MTLNCPFLNLMTTHTIKTLIVRITAISSVTDATTGKIMILPNAVSRGVPVASGGHKK